MSDNLTPVGVQVKVEGEKEYKDAVSQINRQSAILTSEQRKLAAQFNRTADSQEALTAKSENLKKQIDVQSQKIETIRKALENACNVYGENSKAADNWRIKLNNAERDLATLNNKLEDAEDDLRKLASGVDAAGDEMGSAGAKAKKAGKNIKDAGEDAEDAKSKWSDLGSTIKKAFAFGAAVSVSKELFSTVNSLIDSSMELNSDLSKFEQNVKSNNSSLGSMEGHLRNLTALTGETDSSIEALSNLMATGFSDAQTAQALEALSGAVIKFPDTLKIESLSDSLQETIATGKGVGQFFELIERSGYNLDKFNEQLAKGKTQTDRQRIALNWLSQSGLAQVSAEYNEANKNMLDYKKAAYDSATASAELAENLTPVATLVEKLKAKAIKGFSSEIGDISDKVESTSKKASKYLSKFKPDIKSISDSLKKTFSAASNIVEDIADDAQPMLKNISSTVKNTAKVAPSALKTVYKLLKPILWTTIKITEAAAWLSEKTTGIFAQETNELGKLIDSLNESVDAWNDYKEAVSDTLQEVDSELDTIDRARDNLSGLVDENGRLIGSEGALLIAIENLKKNGFDVEYDAVKKQITNYDKLKDKIQEVITLKEYEAKIAQLQALNEKAQTGKASLMTDYSSAISAYDDEYAKLWNSFKTTYNVEDPDAYIAKLMESGNVAVKRLLELKQIKGELKQQLDETLAIEDAYGAALLKGTAGDYDAALSIANTLFDSIEIVTEDGKSKLDMSFQELEEYILNQTQTLDTLIASGDIEIAQWYIDEIANAVAVVQGNGGQISESLVATIQSSLTNFQSLGGEIPESLSTGIQSNSDVVKDAAQATVKNAANVDTSAFVALGEESGEGYVAGITKEIPAARRAAAKLAAAATSTMRKNLEINSPSKLTRRYGQYTGEGVSLGLLDKVRKVQYAAERLSLAVSAPLGTMATSSFTVNNTNYFSDSDARSGNALVRKINRDLGTMYSRR